MRNSENYIRRLKNREEAALEFIMDEFFPLVKGIVRQVLLPLGRRELVEECISDVFLAVWYNAEKFKGEGEEDFRKWLCAIAKYKAIDFYRRERKCVEIPASDQESMDMLPPQASAEEQMLFKENTKEMKELLNSFSDTDRSIFIMKFLWGMSAEEISRKLGLTKSAVDNRIYRSKKELLKGVPSF
ncbi:sigma-70 family RNA polymerase sigma factor [Desulforamulus aeronauticus]|uniref:RNA polymerase sigma-70 factor, ECF subfamily n=1 Tax=Desulforamulus aeronauticus DSM 10349 TaxID=1121421 RepID=A0A1M6RRB3_9FIRM|nr:sigma-70 family RNA polymerase sigma factor [Desulforamulus aeronauticus]SHK35051.1 RNA polymerase sigma-70 factor, ECF subfamily [Desulforamulus aeronauticus DSM 10349]